jgi:trans-2,3-dihydro-3-hydroxyanthranilate isomerase
MRKTLRYVLCDVFTDRPLQGNALAVFTDARSLDAATMQALARELNLSETTFVLPAEKGGHARVRIFTPLRELPFAGHPTLGTAYVLAAPLQLLELRLELGVGIVPVRFELSGQTVSFGWMKQPPPEVIPFAAGPALLDALGVAGSTVPIVAYDNGVQHVFVGVESAAALAGLRPNLAALAALPVGGVAVFAPSAPGRASRFDVRVFAPAEGIPEDPATGSAAGPLGLHLVRHGLARADEEFVLAQGLEIGRPSSLHVRIGQHGAAPEVEVGGRVVSVARGEFILP